MVNLVVRHGTSPLHTTTTRTSIPAVSIGSRERVVQVPSPVIRVPVHVKRPVSPLTTTESLFEPQARSQSPDERASGNSRLSADDLVCDYDRNVTTLYELLESSQWEQARLRCRTHPDEVQTWIVRRDATSTRWKLLPLHAAVIFQAPAPVIESLLQEYPVAAGKRDDQGMLPLHLAFRHKQEESMLELLLVNFPQAVMMRDRRDRLPVDHAGDTHFSAYLLQKYAEAYFHCQIQELQLEAMQSSYEDRIAVMRGEHEEELRSMRQKMEQDQHVIRTQHQQEMDELRDLLSRQVATARNDEQIQDMQQALAQLNEDNQMLRDVILQQKAYHDDLQEQMQQILQDQTTLQTCCEQQQRELEEAQQLRKQLLRSLDQKDDAIKSSREIYQLSETIRLRTEQLLNRDTPLPPPERPINIPFPYENEQVQQWAETNDDDLEDEISAITDDHY